MRTRGFTLIELMIVVAIISILVTLALPVYEHYLVRSQVAEGLSLSAGAKTGMIEQFSNQGTFPTDNSEAGLPSPGSITGRFVSSVTVGNGNGQISILFGGSANAAIHGREVILQGSDNGGSLEWSCSSSSVESRYLPSSCR